MPKCVNVGENDHEMFNLFSSKPDSSQPLVAIVNRSQVVLKKAKGGTTIRSISYGGVYGKPVSCQVSPDNKHVVVVTDNGKVCISDTDKSNVQRDYGGPKLSHFGVGALVVGATWMDNENVIVTTNKGRVFQLNIKNGRIKDKR